VIAASNITPYDAYVTTAGNDSTAVLDDPTHPFATITTALQKRRYAPANIHIGSGTFARVFGDYPSPQLSELRSNLKFYGTAQPTVKADNSGLETGHYCWPLVLLRRHRDL
jgi:hypothetical protein